MREFEIPGGTATLRERADITIGQREALQSAARPVLRAAAALRQAAGRRGSETDEEFQERLQREEEMTPELVDVLSDYREATTVAQSGAIVSLLASWTLDRPLPTMATVRDLNADLWDALATACNEVGDVINPVDFTTKGKADSDTPFVASSASGTSSRSEDRPRRTTRPSAS